ncbi:MAG TPA: protein O-GlcNAcase [Herpetosiphonaceae bacterium]|nr:protein O-GlcNAcase [Herpetosiphonaceae bacterium]
MQQSPFRIRGVIEGFYGPYYTFPERNDLIRFIGKHGFNLYIYGPKNDRQHRARWQQLYPPEVMDQFAETVHIAAQAGVDFCYAIAPLAYDHLKDFDSLTKKLQSFYDRGVRSFSVLVDDIMCATHGNPFCKVCPRPADPHVEVCNRLYEWLTSMDPACALNMCPSEYHGEGPFSDYVHDLGERLHAEIDILYTGPEVCSPAISSADARGYGDAVRRSPLIWDNYPVNDLAMRPYMHIGPIRKRDAKLYEAVRGVVVNPMIQAEASKIPLLTFADYFRDPHGYDPWRSWERALLAVGGKQTYNALLQFAENSLDSPLGTIEPSKLKRLTTAAIVALKTSEQLQDNAALTALREHLETLDEACYELKFRSANLRLRDNLLPWVEALDEWVWIGKRSFVVLDAMASGNRLELAAWNLKRAVEEIKDQAKKVGGSALLPLAQRVLELAADRKPQPVALHSATASAA